ncbi:hypothetical protein [Pseudarthrobacter sulfonivorans]|uniref:hypothetical protein n=1 Tax=Pseudarthrobacter sulfonivorans TaxID=121292 RepID=UPI00277E9CBB|nr:hypothetical protein [Pseudarthrobacter sulfonivorans]MDP9999425.1 hypothetical protein [Pseudarthrobacter sulfonivorans]
MLRWSERIDTLIEYLRADLPDLQVDIRPVTTEQPFRIIDFRPSSESLEVVELIEGSEELIVLFGVNLRHELGLTDESSAEAALKEASQLLHSIIFDGYEESTWARKNGVVRTEARINYAGQDHKFATSTLTGFFGGRKQVIWHRPW